MKNDYGVRAEVLEFPAMVVIESTHICNAKCPNCPYTNSDIRLKYNNTPFMSWDILKRVADECIKHKSLIRITGGGEPMLNPHIVDFIVYVKENGGKISMITNGSKFTYNTLKKVIGHKIDAIEFSVDAGNKKEYLWARSGLDWDILNRNVKNAINIRNQISPDTRIIASIINQKNINVKRAEAYWTKVVDKVMIRKFLTWNYNDSSNSADSVPFLPIEKNIPCPYPFERLYVNPRGGVSICGCQDIAADYVIANIMEESIKNIWHGHEFTNLRKVHLAGHSNNVPVCVTCENRQYLSWNYNYLNVFKDVKNDS